MMGVFRALIFLYGEIGIRNVVRFLSIAFILFVGYHFWTKETFVESESRKAAEIYNKNVDKLLKQTNNVKEKQGTFYVYTNDPDPLKISLAPDIRHASGRQDLLQYISTYREADEIASFLAYENAGYFVQLHNRESAFSQFLVPAHGRDIRQASPKKFALFVDFEYTAEELVAIKKIYDKHVQQTSIGFNQEKEELFSEDWFGKYESDGIILEAEELNSGEVQGLRSLYQPRINLKNPTYKFYFSCYNFDASKEEFKAAINRFNELYLKGDTSFINNCVIRELSFQSNECIDCFN